jgi:hypothetical protein
MITNNAQCTRKIKYRIITAKAALTEKTLFTSKLDFNLRKKLVKQYIWNITLYGATTWTLQKVDQKYLKSFEMWCWRRTNISWSNNGVKNEDVLHRIKEERNILHTVKRNKTNLTGHIWLRNSFLKYIIEGKMEERTEITGRQERRCKKPLYEFQGTRGYWKLKEEALEFTLRTNCLGRGYGTCHKTDHGMNL